MAAPWEKYAPQPAQAGPWAKYAAPKDDTPPAVPATENPPPTWGQAIKNVAEAGGKMMSGAVSSVAGDVAGLASLIAPPAMIARGLGYEGGILDPTNVRNKIISAGTYQPSNPDSLSNKIVDAPGRMVGGAGDYLQKQTEKLGIPYLDRVAGAVPLAAANLLGVKAAKVGTFDASPYGGAADMQLPKAAPAALARAPVPTTEELTAASKKAYADAKEANVVVPASGYEKALGSVQRMTKEEGINPTLHPKSTAVMKVLEEAQGKDLGLQEAETLRKIALDAEDDLNPVTRQPTPDARIAGKIVDELDDKIDALSTNDQARALWARSRRSQMVDRMISRAEIKAGAHYTQAGMEHALRQEFKQLALNDRRMRGLTAEQKASIKKVASGGPMENTLRALGKFDPTSGGMAAFASIGTSAAAAPATGGLSAALPFIGFGAKRAATKMTKTNVDLAREALVGRGLTPATPKAAPMLSNELARALIGQGKTRTAAAVQSDIDRLVQRAGSQNIQPSSASARAIWQELERLQAELSSASAREATQGAPVAPPSR